MLARAQKAATEKDAEQDARLPEADPEQAWEIGKGVVPQVPLHYLKMHCLA